MSRLKGLLVASTGISASPDDSRRCLTAPLVIYGPCATTSANTTVQPASSAAQMVLCASVLQVPDGSLERHAFSAVALSFPARLDARKNAGRFGERCANTRRITSQFHQINVDSSYATTGGIKTELCPANSPTLAVKGLPGSLRVLR